MVKLAYVMAGSEATGGAGFQVDIKTFQQLGVYGVGTLTCIVSFDPANNWGHRFVPVDAQVIADQFEAANAAHDLDVVKIGMLGTPATIDVVATCLASKPWRHVVLDPVLICKGQQPGAALDTDTALRQKVLPLATVVTPNNFEAATLAGIQGPLTTVDAMVDAARAIHELGTQYVVVKGGVDLPGSQAIDILFDGHDVTTYASPKVGEERVSGAGCTFAAAITAELAKGASVKDAVRVAKAMVDAGIAARVHAHTPFDTVWQGAYRG